MEEQVIKTDDFHIIIKKEEIKVVAIKNGHNIHILPATANSVIIKSVKF
jgi:hypothetical protein